LNTGKEEYSKKDCYDLNYWIFL